MRYSLRLNQIIEDMYKGMTFCHLEENLEINMVKN